MNPQLLTCGSAWASVETVPLDRSAVELLVTKPEAGAVVSFAGVVRNHDSARAVTGLEYVAHPDAASMLLVLATEAMGWLNVQSVAVSHRTGRLEVGEVALLAAVSAAHRADAFSACQRLVDEVKLRVPVWKRQHFADGDPEWVGCP